VKRGIVMTLIPNATDQTISGQHTREPGDKQTAPDSTPAANSRIREIEREGWEG
jgi:hypothetical protein